MRTTADLESANLHIAELEAAGLLGMVEEGGHVTAYFPERMADLPLDGRWEAVVEQDWNALWKAGIEPVRVGAVTITPPWIDTPGALVIEPAQAFGTGHHETTTGCLAALQELDLAGASVFDVGCGTGVLALAAKQLGAGRVVAVDNDEIAVRTSRENAQSNGLEIDVELGSADAADTPFDVVVANLDTPTLCTLAEQLAAATAVDGVLIASGVSLERADEACTALQGAGLDVDVAPGEEWAVLRARHRHVAEQASR